MKVAQASRWLSRGHLALEKASTKFMACFELRNFELN
jgi:hypothetical protein